MRPLKITSTSNPKIKHLIKLIKDKNYRHDCKEYVIEGMRCLDNNNGIKELYLREDVTSGSIKCKNTYHLGRDIFNKISSTENSQGIIAVSALKICDCSGISAKHRYILLDKIQDPGNMGTMIRTACAFNFKGVIITKGCVDPFSPKVVRSAAGSIENLDIIIINNASELGNYTVIAADPKGKNIAGFKWPESFILAIGNEANGLSRELISITRHLVAIRISGKIESLNAAVSAAILIYDSQRQNS